MYGSHIFMSMHARLHVYDQIFMQRDSVDRYSNLTLKNVIKKPTKFEFNNYFVYLCIYFSKFNILISIYIE